MTSHKITVRFASKEDVDFIYKSLKEMAIEENMSERFSQTKESLRYILFSQNRFAEVLIAECDKLPSGLCLFHKTNRNFHLFKKPGIYVDDIYVHPDYRRMSIATSLENSIINVAKDRNCDRVDGVVIKNNVQGQQFCQSLSEVNVVDYIDYVRAKL